MAVTMNNRPILFWDVTPCSLVEVYRRARGTSVNVYPTTQCYISEDNILNKNNMVYIVLM
jgi:hypothetical protein